MDGFTGEFDLRSAPPVVLHNIDTPTICALNGGAAGYGLDLALGCDIRIAAENAKLNPGFAKRGILPESGGTWLLPRMVGYAKAAEIAFTGRTLSAAEALELGLVNQVVAVDEFDKRTAEMAADIAANAPLAVRAIKRMMRAAETETFEQNVHHVFLQLLPLLRTDDFTEGVRRVHGEARSRVPRSVSAGRTAGLAPRRAGDHPRDPPIHRRPDPRRRPRHDPVARGARSVGFEPSAVPVPRAARRSTGDRRQVAARRGVPSGLGGASGKRDGYRPSTVRRLDAAVRRPLRTDSLWSCSCASSATAAPSPYEGASVYPACQNLLLAARALGYGGALTMWHLGVEAELRDLLEVPAHVALSACITLGVPEGNHGPVKRKPVGEVVYDDTWGQSATWI